MIVRGFCLSDYREVNVLLQNVLSEACYGETVGALARQLSWDTDMVIVAELEGSIAGVIIGTIDHNKGYYYRIAVDANSRRRGIGKALIQALRKRFTERKVDRILITADQHNEPVLHLYEKAGYNTQDFTQAYDQLSIVSGG